ncbi:12825_t:CDS:2 [Entrophospora sp. SA101]|nr:12825_t:CDS:2 [Entrophospora sp. SA101]
MKEGEDFTNINQLHDGNLQHTYRQQKIEILMHWEEEESDASKQRTISESQRLRNVIVEKNLNDQNEVFRYLVNKNTNYAKARKCENISRVKMTNILWDSAVDLEKI